MQKKDRKKFFPFFFWHPSLRVYIICYVGLSNAPLDVGIWVFGYTCIYEYMYPPTQCLLNSPFASHEEETGRQPARGLSSNGTSGSSSAVYPAPAVPTTKSIIICRQQRLYNQLNTFNKHLYYQQMTIPCQLANFHIHHHVGHLQFCAFWFGLESS